MRMPVVSSMKTLPLSLRASTAEEDGYLVTLTTDMNADASYCLVFDAPGRRRPGLQNPTAGTDFQQHPLHLGGGLRVAPLASLTVRTVVGRRRR